MHGNIGSFVGMVHLSSIIKHIIVQNKLKQRFFTTYTPLVT